MRARLALAAFVLVLALAALYLGTAGRRAGSAERGDAVAPDAHDRDGAELASVPLAPERDSVPRQESALEPTPPVASSSTPAAVAPRPVEERVHLRGLLVHSSDRRPSAGATLVFLCDGETGRAVTDSEGRFAVEFPAPCTAVRIWNRGGGASSFAEQLEIQPGTFLLSEARREGAAHEIELVLVDPAAWLEVEVVAADGAPSEAVLRWEYRAPAGSVPSWRNERSPTDPRGRSRLPFWSVAPGARMSLMAVLRQDVVAPVREHVALVSDEVTIEPPLPDAPVRLVLDAGGTIRVRALDAQGEPLEDGEIQLRAEETAPGLRWDDKSTDAAGVATFTALAPGRYRVSCRHAATPEWFGAEVELERGEVDEVELRAPGLPLAVAGRVVNVDGGPAGGVNLVVAIGEWSTGTATDAQGAFSVGSAERGPVRVSTVAGPWTDRYEPAEVEVPFGTLGVEFRQREPLSTTPLTLEVLERGSLARIPDAMVLAFVEPERSGWSFHRAREGVATLQLKLHDDVGLSVEAVGYRRRIVLAAEVARDVPAGETCKVVLEPGLERALRILDAESGEPLVAARVLDGERLVATAGGDGRAEIDLPAWPVELRVQAAGHVESVWSCRDWISELGDGEVALARAQPEGR